MPWEDLKNLLPFAGLEKLIKETETKASVPLMGFLTRGRRDYEADAGDETFEVEGGGSGKEMIEADEPHGNDYGTRWVSWFIWSAVWTAL